MDTDELKEWLDTIVSQIQRTESAISTAEKSDLQADPQLVVACYHEARYCLHQVRDFNTHNRSDEDKDNVKASIEAGLALLDDILISPIEKGTQPNSTSSRLRQVIAIAQYDLYLIRKSSSES
jgi:hypothetical protein